MSTDRDAQAEGIRFAEIVTGTTTTDAPPPPGSRLAQLLDLAAEKDREGHSQQWLEDQAMKLYRS